MLTDPVSSAPAPVSPALIAELERLCPGGVVQGLPLAQVSRWRIGGPADLVLRPAGIEELAALRAFFHREGLPHLVIGATTNLLFSDAGLRPACIQIDRRMAGIEAVSPTEILAEAGAWAPRIARVAMQMGLTGAEHVCGIPGTLGGLVCMNGGSQRKGIGSALVEAVTVDPTGAVGRRRAEDCGFAYRRSVFQENGEVVAAARLRFDPVEAAGLSRSEVRRAMLAIMADRRRKFPQKEPNCGSVFKSNPAMYDDVGPPGAAIERLGFKGRRIGGALCSPHHANFVVNTGAATARDTLALITEIRDAVLAATGYEMEVEARYVSRDGGFHPALLPAPD